MTTLPEPTDPRKRISPTVRSALLDLEWACRQLPADDPVIQELEEAILAVRVALDELGTG